MELRNTSMGGGCNGGSGYRSGSYAVGTALEKEYSLDAGTRGSEKAAPCFKQNSVKRGMFVGTKTYDRHSFLCGCSYGRRPENFYLKETNRVYLSELFGILFKSGIGKGMDQAGN